MEQERRPPKAVNGILQKFEDRPVVAPLLTGNAEFLTCSFLCLNVRPDPVPDLIQPE